MNTRHRIWPVLLAVFVTFILILALVYCTGVVFFRTHFLFNTTFLGNDISQRETDAVEECMEAESDARSLTILEMDGSQEVIKLAEAIEYQRTVAEPADGWIPKNAAWCWPLSLWEENDITDTESISYSREKLEEVVNSLDAMDPANVTPPRDAYLDWRDGVCFIVPSVDGNKLYPYRVVNALAEAIENDEDTVDLAAENCYEKAYIRSDNEHLLYVLGRYRSINFQQIEIDMTGETITLTSDDVLSFYNTVLGGELVLREDAVAEFVKGLKDKYDTYERQRPFVNRYGNEITVGTRADTYGFKMDLDATIALLTDTLNAHERLAQIEPVWTNAGWTRRENGSDIGGTYIEVSISEQYLWAYINGERVMGTSVVTGNSGNHDTPRGVFRILYKERNATLVGQDYSSPVSYWMPITWGGVGLHDATWRSSFGGSIYRGNGSHGCINMPTWAAKQLYNSFSSGTPVIVW